jgi:uncharacterized RDD family membrane protein YckC
VTEVVTGEAVVLAVPYARFPSRLVARAIDTAIQFLLLLLLGLVVGAAAARGGLDAASGAAIGLIVTVLILVGYPVIWETASRGATPGKFALGLRVISDDGGPERFRQALVRGLVGVVEIWLLLGFPALLSALLSADGKRLGDFVAGTRVIQRRLPSPAPAAGLFAVPPALVTWAASLELASLRDDTAETARQYLSRFAQLTPAARAELGTRLAAAVAAQVSPPPPAGTPAADYLAAVLAERSRRAHARLAASAASMSPPASPWAPPPAGAMPAAMPPSGVPSAARQPGQPAGEEGPGEPPPTTPEAATGTGGFSPPV